MLLLWSFIFKHSNERNPKHSSLSTVSIFNYVNHFRGGKPTIGFSASADVACVYTQGYYFYIFLSFQKCSTTLERREGTSYENVSFQWGQCCVTTISPCAFALQSFRKPSRSSENCAWLNRQEYQLTTSVSPVASES